jgi:hypothetical protein
VLYARYLGEGGGDRIIVHSCAGLAGFSFRIIAQSQRRHRTAAGAAAPRGGYTAPAPVGVMGFLSFLYPWGILLQGLAVVHFLRRRPETVWLFVIVFLGPPGALIYIAIEVVPDLGLLRHAFDAFGRRKRIRHLEALVLQNPSAGNYEELADLYLEEEKFAKAQECYDKAISPRTAHTDPIYRRAIAEIHLEDFAAAVSDLEQVTAREPRYDSHRAIALLAHAYARSGRASDADRLFRQATELSTLSETYINYATFLAAQNRPAEARQWVEAVLARKPTMPRYLQRRERPWLRQANALLKRLRAVS